MWFLMVMIIYRLLVKKIGVVFHLIFKRIDDLENSKKVIKNGKMRTAHVGCARKEIFEKYLFL